MVEHEKHRGVGGLFIAVAIVLLVLAGLFVYSFWQAPVAAGANSGNKVVVGANLRAPIVANTVSSNPVASDAIAVPAATVAPTVAPTVAAGNLVAPVSSVGACVLFKNRFTGEFKCVLCTESSNNPTSECIYTSRDWVQFALGASGYACENDATRELGCSTVKIG